MCDSLKGSPTRHGSLKMAPYVGLGEGALFVTVAREGAVVLWLLVSIVEMHVELVDSDFAEDVLRLLRHVAAVRLRSHFDLEGSDEHVWAERPEVRLLHRQHSVEPGDFLVAFGQFVVEFVRLPLHEDEQRVADKREDADGDAESDEERADRIGDHPTELVHQDGRDDDSDAAQSVGQDVQKDSLHDLRAS